MTTRILEPFAPPAPQRHGSDFGYAAVEFLTRLTDTLRAATPFRDACKKQAAKQSRWGVPRLFFFDRRHDPVPPPPVFPDPYALPTARKNLNSAAAWANLSDLCDDAQVLLAGAVEARHAARAMPEFLAAARDFAGDHPKLRATLELLEVADDLMVTAVHPAAGWQWRVRLVGVADLYQFHALLAHAVGWRVAGPAYDLDVAAAYQDAAPNPNLVATARFQLFRPQAVGPDGRLPTRFCGSEHWLWGHEHPREIPKVKGEPTVYLADAAYPRQWPAVRKVPLIAGDLAVEQTRRIGVVAPTAVAA